MTQRSIREYAEVMRRREIGVLYGLETALALKDALEDKRLHLFPTYSNSAWLDKGPGDR